MPDTSGYITQLIIPGFEGSVEQWINKRGVIEPASGGGGTALSPACFTINDTTEMYVGNLVDTAAFVGGSLLCFRKNSAGGASCFASLEVKTEFSALKPESLTFSFQGGAYGYGPTSYFEFSVYDAEWNALGNFSFSEAQTEPFDMTETIVLDYESNQSSGIAFILVENSSMAY